MANHATQNQWALKYRKKNDRPPPEIYEKANTSLLEAQPEPAGPGQSLPRLPTENDFPKAIENRIISFIGNTAKEDVRYIIVVLHGYAANQLALQEFATKQLLGPRTACLFVQGPTQVGETGTYCWSDTDKYIGGPGGNDRKLKLIRRVGTGFSSLQSAEFAGPSRSNTANTTTESLDGGTSVVGGGNDEDISWPTYGRCVEQIGIEVISDVLIKKCGFAARDIAIVGHDQGGTAALAVAAACWETKFGGVVSIGGPLPNDFPDRIGSQTHVLLLGGTLGDLKDRTECARIKKTFAGVTQALKEYESPASGDEDDTIDIGGDDYNNIEDGELKEFVAHQLRREEWEKEAVITFDGGGIRGYGSLLILRELVREIANTERDLDRDAVSNGRPQLSESSFSPCQYPAQKLGQRTIRELDDEERYLPCHYFTFAGGTSTGGLISIMLSRFRMTVGDCIKEYEEMGEKIFGHPRPPGPATVLMPWHKFDADNLKRAITNVMDRHNEDGATKKRADGTDIVPFPSHPDLCKTIVAARADKGGALVPFLFRTYNCRDDDPATSKNRPQNAGPAASCCITEVGRATSAATNYFRPIDIKNWGIKEIKKDIISFVDGGFGLNNPSHEVLRDIKLLRKAPNEIIDVFASFGTGVSDASLKGKLSSLLRMVEEMKKEITNVLPAHKAMEDASGIHDERRFHYFRFDGGEVLGKIALDEWSGRRRSQMKLRTRPTGEETLKAMEIAVNKYLKKENVKNDLNSLAKILVRRRRLRTRDENAWKRYACAERYECSVAGCGTWLNTPEQFEDHLNTRHSDLSEDDRSNAHRDVGSKKMWTYKIVERD